MKHRTSSRAARFAVSVLILVSVILCTLFGRLVRADVPVPAENVEQQMDIVYGEAGGVPLQLDAYLQQSAGPNPAVVFVHGGGFVTGDKRTCPSYILEPFLRNGYSVLSVNYRLAP